MPLHVVIVILEAPHHVLRLMTKGVDFCSRNLLLGAGLCLLLSNLIYLVIIYMVVVIFDLS